MALFFIFFLFIYLFIYFFFFFVLLNTDYLPKLLLISAYMLVIIDKDG